MASGWPLGPRCPAPCSLGLCPWLLRWGKPGWPGWPACSYPWHGADSLAGTAVCLVWCLQLSPRSGCPVPRILSAGRQAWTQCCRKQGLRLPSGVGLAPLPAPALRECKKRDAALSPSGLALSPSKEPLSSLSHRLSLMQPKRSDKEECHLGRLTFASEGTPPTNQTGELAVTCLEPQSDTEKSCLYSCKGRHPEMDKLGQGTDVRHHLKATGALKPSGN